MSGLELVLSKLPHAKRNGKGWRARCPAHDDHDPSLSISEGDDGRVLLHCGAGCAFAEICAAMGVDPRDLAPNATSETPPKRKAKGGKPPTVYATPDAAAEAIAKWTGGTLAGSWTYHKPDGTEAFRMLRFDLANGGKTFRPIRPVPGGWAQSDPPGPLPLYRLPSLDGAGRVFLAEGEKCTEAVRAFGLAATTSAHGARAVRKTDWTPLAGREVIILPDKDDAGRTYAEAVAKALLALTPPATAKVLDLPGLGDGEDVADYLDGMDGKTAEELAEHLNGLADGAPIYTPPADDSDGRRAVLRCMADVQPEEVRWLWPGRFPLGMISILFGDPNVGKSYLTTDMAARVSAGLPWPDTPDAPNEPGGVILLSAEDDPNVTIRPRLNAAGADVQRVHILDGVITEGHDDPVLFSLRHDLRELAAAIGKRPETRLVFIDPLGAYLPGTKTHVDSEVRSVLAPLSALAGRYGVAIVAIMHKNKAPGGKALYRAMGSVGFVALARAVWLLAPDRQNPERRLLLPAKMNIAPRITGLAFRLDGNDGGVPRIEWESDPVTLSADDVTGPEGDGGGGTALDEAKEWLRYALADGSLPSKDMQRMAEDAGHAWATVKRAKTALDVQAQKEGFGPEATWYWTLPEQRCSSDPKDAQPENVSAFADDERLWEGPGQESGNSP